MKCTLQFQSGNGVRSHEPDAGRAGRQPQQRDQSIGDWGDSQHDYQQRRAATRLAQGGFPCNISPPVIIGPLGSRFTTFGSSQLRVTFNSNLGPLTVRISLYETPVRD